MAAFWSKWGKDGKPGGTAAGRPVALPAAGPVVRPKAPAAFDDLFDDLPAAPARPQAARPVVAAPPSRPATAPAARPAAPAAPRPAPQPARASAPLAPQKSASRMSQRDAADARKLDRARVTVETGVGILAADGVVKSFKGRRVVDGASLYVRRGEAVGLLGPNGAGKTTCFYMIVGLIPADEGRIDLDGHDITPFPMYRRARLGIGYLPQEASIFRGLTVEDNIRAVLEVAQKDRTARERKLDALLDEFGLTRLRKSPAIALSGGERRRTEIARTLASDPAFILLDEPFAGIDPIAVGDIQDLVQHLTERGIGVLITDHNVRETLGLIDRAYIIHSGRVLMEGTPDEIVSNPDVRRLYLGEEFRL